ncbi:hypothetical protein FF011L_53290 [Roseimaritima multifibrata]|uniref:Protein BatD n=1 Tax=Roseimaritima multifibrata TaxID=1930274 RepID=A0A517MP14_9BACT|nr:BatD family protein [Roseimaritima multifibrata]QDS96517.1 hypothetical protein FF011L_53290 [Roseimaritima multifibrata]
MNQCQQLQSRMADGVRARRNAVTALPERSRPNVIALLAATAVLCFASTTFASDPTVTAVASADQVQVAEPFTLEITVEANQGSKVTFPEGQTALGDFDVRDTSDAFDIPSADDPGKRTWTRVLKLESLAAGELQIPPMNIQVGENGKVALLATQPVRVRVASVLEDRADPTQFRDIESVVDVSIPENNRNSMVSWGTGIAGLAALALLVGVAVQRRRRWTTPLAWAREQFDALDPADEFVLAKLSHVAREFLVMQFEMPETGSTPQEITARLLTESQIDAKTCDRFNELFDLADKSKFAGLQLSPDESARAIGDSRTLIEQLANDLDRN